MYSIQEVAGSGWGSEKWFDLCDVVALKREVFVLLN